MRLLIATKNAHKTGEIRRILGEPWKIEDLTRRPEIEAPEETGATFQENAAIKAIEASRRFPGYVLADDSGLEVDALGGAPGVISARYAGAGSTDAENRARLLRELALFPAVRVFDARCALLKTDASSGNLAGLSKEPSWVQSAAQAASVMIPCSYRKAMLRPLASSLPRLRIGSATGQKLWWRYASF